MKLTILLADAAQDAPNGKISALGAGWTRISHPVRGFVVLGFAELGRDEADRPHKIVITLCDGAGNPFRGDLDEEVIRVDVGLDGGRADDLAEYESVRIQFAVQIPAGMPTPPGGYEFQAVADNDPQSRTSYQFRVMEPLPNERTAAE
ncbi:DUF6941 family protein [Nocardia sp. NPDC058666]|uniref:DUF6941 family protein n=1 Tax=unclassified Nocardia TaxID=2637762 RepID=UPI003649E9F2